MSPNLVSEPVAAIKATLRSRLGPARYKALYLIYYRLVSSGYILSNSTRKIVFRSLFQRDERPRQQPTVWETHLPSFSGLDDLKEYLRLNGITYQEGNWTVYIPPQAQLGRHFGRVAGFYPLDAGFKIVKDFRAPGQAEYLRHEASVSWLEARLLRKASSLLDSACTLEVLRLGPRIYDLAELRAGQTRLTCFVVKHVESQPVTAADRDSFIARLDSGSVAEVLGTVVPHRDHPHSDFLPPNCNNNLFKDEQGELLYIDFQQFAVLDPARLPLQLITSEFGKLSFGDVNFLRSNLPYLYQTIPGIRVAGKRDTALRWHRIVGLLASAGIEIKGRLILDICCNSGIMSSMALSDGALWALGWDRPQVAEIALQLQRSLGFSRIDIKRAPLSAEYPLLADLHPRFKPYLDESIVLYLAAVNHIGLMSELARIPWRALIFEGHENLHREDYADAIAFFERDCRGRLVGQVSVQDGDSRPRCLLLFVRP